MVGLQTLDLRIGVRIPAPEQATLTNVMPRNGSSDNTRNRVGQGLVAQDGRCRKAEDSPSCTEQGASRKRGQGRRVALTVHTGILVRG